MELCPLDPPAYTYKWKGNPLWDYTNQKTKEQLNELYKQTEWIKNNNFHSNLLKDPSDKQRDINYTGLLLKAPTTSPISSLLTPATKDDPDEIDPGFDGDKHESDFFQDNFINPVANLF
jgi:hypothetical protein